MKKNIVTVFVRRGLVSLGIGPLVLAILYWILYLNGCMETLTVPQVCIGIVSISALAFIAGGMNSIYQIERLPLMVAILIHGAVLYGSYLITYLVNDWLESGWLPILVFSGIFIVGYFAIWAVIYFIVKKRTAKLNEILREKQGQGEE